MPIIEGQYTNGLLNPTSSAATESLTTAPIIIDPVNQQIIEDDIDTEAVIHPDYDQAAEETDAPLYEDEPVIRKRLVKIVDGKIVDSRITYIKRYAISSAIGNGYIFVSPTLNAGTIEYTPIKITLQ